MTPRVSVVVPTRNRRALLARALDSVAAQTFRDFEVLVVDDGSSDGTLEWLRRCRPAVRAIGVAHGGAGAARNRGIREARGELIAFLDDDDVWREGYVEAQVAHLDANPEADLSFADHLERDSRGRLRRPDTRALLDYPDVRLRMAAECFVHTLSVVVCRRAVFSRCGLFDECLSVVHDLEWYLRVLGGGRRFVHLAAPLVEHEVPGGLVAHHRRWYGEEHEVLRRMLAAVPREHAAAARTVFAYRSLFFARVAFGRGDLAFGLERLAASLAVSTSSTVRIAARRLGRNLRARWRPAPLDGAGGTAWLPPGR